MSVTIDDIAKLTGFSITTVSRVLNKKAKKYRISKKTADIINKKAIELGYRPNDIARSLRLKKTNLVGLIVPDISNPFFSYITSVIQNLASEYGYSLIVANTNEDIEKEIENIEIFRRKGVDGYIIMPVGIKHEHLEELIKYNKALVLLDRNISVLNANCVVVNNYLGSYEATEYLIRMGHKRIGVIQGLPNTSTNNERLLGYRNALADNGIPIDETLIMGNDFRSENGYLSTIKLMELKEPPTVIFAFSDLITLGTIKACYEKGYRIPDDVSIIAFDDFEFAPFLQTPITVIEQPKYLMAEYAIKLLIENMRNNNPNLSKRKIVLSPKLIIRNSVKKLNELNFINAKVVY
ncbi:LacI family DNA-binding transcriptional regulator [Ignavibacteria bacterium 4148-Me]|uniref:LacI family DNA-binding transcriptional regulator n=1 Tax=Rosettibacter primus TaxID=3111523 RepID=UPI00336BB156